MTTDPLEMNIMGRIMLMAHKHGLQKPSGLTIYARAVMDALQARYPDGRPSLLAMESSITEELTLLDSALHARRSQATPAVLPEVPPPSIEETSDDADDSGPAVQEAPKTRERRKVTRAAVEAKSREEKLQDERKPVQKLLQEDCVQMGLIDGKTAKRMIKAMVGKEPVAAEQEIVEVMRQRLQDQVKTYIRRHKGGPWAKPSLQEALRQDIHRARTLQSIIMMTRQIMKERQQWEKANGKGGGMLGLFSGRRKILGG